MCRASPVFRGIERRPGDTDPLFELAGCLGLVDAGCSHRHPCAEGHLAGSSRSVDRPSHPDLRRRRRRLEARLQSAREPIHRHVEGLRSAAARRRSQARSATPAKCGMSARRRRVQARPVRVTICAPARRSRQRLPASPPEKVMATIQGGPTGDPVWRLYPTLASRRSRLAAIGGKNQRQACGSILVPPTRRPAADRSLPCGRKMIVGGDKSYEAHVPAKEAQASPGSRISCPHAVARRAPDAQAPPRQGTQASLYLKAIRAR